MKKIAVLFVLIFAFCGCEDDSEDLKNQARVERFSCKVDGKLWVADDDSEFMTGYRGVWGSYAQLPSKSGKNNQYLITLVANNNSTINISQAKEGGITLISDTLDGLNSKGNLSRESSLYIYTDYEKRGSPTEYYDIVGGEIKLHSIDSVLRKFQGTFQFEAVEKKTGKKVLVTEGRFNLK